MRERLIETNGGRASVDWRERLALRDCLSSFHGDVCVCVWRVSCRLGYRNGVVIFLLAGLLS